MSLRTVATVGVVDDIASATDFPAELAEELLLLTKLLLLLLPILSFFAGVVSHLSLFLANAVAVDDDDAEEEQEEEETTVPVDEVPEDGGFDVVFVAVFAALST